MATRAELKAARLAARDMLPYCDVLYNTARHYKSGMPIDILEIGVRRGSSTKAFLRGIKDRLGEAHLYSIDKGDRSRIVRSKDYNQYWTFILGDSTMVKWDKKIDVLFIDGDHSYEGVKKDFLKYEPYVKSNGLIFMHDITHKHFGVKEFWKEVGYPKANLALNGVGFGIINKI